MTKFNLQYTIQKSNKGAPLLYIKAESRERFIDKVKPYMHEDKKYKILPGVNPNYKEVVEGESLAKSSLASRKKMVVIKLALLYMQVLFIHMRLLEIIQDRALKLF